jgi:hypothetical protein
LRHSVAPDRRVIEERLRALEAELAAAIAVQAALMRQRQEVEDMFRRSASWRVTAPLRAVSAWIAARLRR